MVSEEPSDDSASLKGGLAWAVWWATGRGPVPPLVLREMRCRDRMSSTDELAFEGGPDLGARMRAYFGDGPAALD
jgi:hypothetical protein